ncbi:hypothetical protein ACFWIJ_00285 [Streptomyces sp. NPDC127079]|uniref:hypothetical protein n=1 Tax=Streptomyces sp. NPDC127079 TaxID=3347132 RepID=UPI00364A65FE
MDEADQPHPQTPTQPLGTATSGPCIRRGHSRPRTDLLFTAAPRGKITPPDAHVRRAAQDRRKPPPIVRRAYNYQHGNSDRGLLFSCFQPDLEQDFEAVQGRLQGEAVTKYSLTVGGAYYFVPPPGTAWLGTLTEAYWWVGYRADRTVQVPVRAVQRQSGCAGARGY